MSEPENPSNLPEGRRVSKSNSNRETLYLKRQQLLREMQSTEELRPINVREQVETLKNAGSEGTKEEDWGSKEKRRKGSPWMLWAILGLAIPVVLVGLMIVSGGKRGKTASGNSGMGLDFDVLSGAGQVEAEDWFIKNPGEAFEIGLNTLETVSKEGFTLEEVSPLVRSPEQAERLVQLERAGEWVAFDTSVPTDLVWDYGSSGDAGFMVLMGQKKDFHDFRAYFVRDEGEVLMDVDATEARSDIPVIELPGQTLTQPVLMRCWLAKEPHFDARSDERLFSWYQILSPNKVDFVWAYCTRGDAIDEALRKELNYGRLIGERKDYLRATVRLTNAKGFREDEFQIQEYVASEWVLPSSE
ncbi:hypothetical protein AAFN60_11570 [Roseibacillus persicicus]|uniref:hypothetical protein n=1 Tax=Roseibacillus persicicus TaxID=454148 RepID=UPI00398AC3CF